MAQTKTQRRAAGRKGAQTRKRNQQLATSRQDEPNKVELPDEQRTTEQDVMRSYGVNPDAHDEPWVRPSELEAPEPRQGFTQRWIRIRIGNNDDPRNSMRKFREGWLPRRLETCPVGYLPPTFSHAKLGDVIGVEDLILCEMPVKKALQRNAFYEAKKDRAIEGIEGDLRKVSQGGPRIAQSSKSHTTKRRLRVPTDPTE